MVTSSEEPEDYFYKLLEIDPVYEHEDLFFEPFWQFQNRFLSLQRYWELNKNFIGYYTATLKNIEGDDSAEFYDFYSETASQDIEYFPENIRLSIITFSLSLVENLLGSLSEEVAKDLGIEIDLDNRKLPYIDKHLLWFVRGCGMEINIDKSMRKSLDAIREIRNRFIHKIDRDIPDQIKKVINEMIASSTEGENIITDEFVDISLSKLAELVKEIELAYIKFYEKLKIK
jgi:hypothetical protein